MMMKLDGNNLYWDAKKKSRKLFLQKEVEEIRKKLTDGEYYTLKEYFKLENVNECAED